MAREDAPGVGDNVLMGSCPVPEQYEQPKGFSVLIGIDDPVDAERIFHPLAENGTVQTPLQNTFWSVRLGVLDRLDLAFSEGKPRL
jgi:PhnB protein